MIHLWEWPLWLWTKYANKFCKNTALLYLQLLHCNLYAHIFWCKFTPSNLVGNVACCDIINRALRLQFALSNSISPTIKSTLIVEYQQCRFVLISRQKLYSFTGLKSGCIFHKWPTRKSSGANYGWFRWKSYKMGASVSKDFTMVWIRGVALDRFQCCSTNIVAYNMFMNGVDQ